MLTKLRKALHLYKNPSYNARLYPQGMKKTKCLFKYKLLFKGRCQGYDYFILDLQSHPTAYVKVNKKHAYYGKDYYDLPAEFDYIVHGGLTFASGYLKYNGRIHQNGWYFGWDYAHAGDYYAFNDYGTLAFCEEKIPPFLQGKSNKDKKWKTEEIIEDCEKFCKALKERG